MTKKATCLFSTIARPKAQKAEGVCVTTHKPLMPEEHKPQGSAQELAAGMGINLLTEAEYRELQQLGEFDTKTSSWVQTPEAIRKRGGAIFAIAVTTPFSVTTRCRIIMRRADSEVR
jgi:hypothetical protein